MSLKHARTTLLLFAVAAASAPAVSLACSGPGAEELIERNFWLGLELWAVAVVLAAGAWLMGARWFSLRQRVLLTLLVLVHPGLWEDVATGDCGFTRRDDGLLATALGLALIVYALWTRSGRADVSTSKLAA